MPCRFDMLVFVILRTRDINPLPFFVNLPFFLKVSARNLIVKWKIFSLTFYSALVVIPTLNLLSLSPSSSQSRHGTRL